MKLKNIESSANSKYDPVVRRVDLILFAEMLIIFDIKEYLKKLSV